MIIDFPKSPQPPFQGGVQRLRLLYLAQNIIRGVESFLLPLEKGAGGILGIAYKMLP